jgi:hypothetical protein
MKLITQASQKIAERLTWCTASRDQAAIAKDLAEGKEISDRYRAIKGMVAPPSRSWAVAWTCCGGRCSSRDRETMCCWFMFSSRFL